MATLKDYFVTHGNLEKFISEHNLLHFIETGTGLGDTVDFVKDSFTAIWSIELIEAICDKARQRFWENKNVRIYCGESVAGLEIMLGSADVPVLFFLDAHFPGADFGYARYDSEKDPDKRIPLQKEIETILKCRGEAVKNDCFIIDDLRVYEDGEYGDGNWPLRKELGGDGIGFIYDAFGETHYIEKDYRYQGFIVLTPWK
jgi:hypothetical protein